MSTVRIVAKQPVERWTDRAACAGSPADFHPFPNSWRAVWANPSRVARERARAADALAVCATCPVIDQCRDWARADPAVGPWAVAGGQVPGERVRAPCWGEIPRYRPPVLAPDRMRARTRSPVGHGGQGWARGCRCADCTIAHAGELATSRAFTAAHPWYQLSSAQRSALLASQHGTVTTNPRITAALLRRQLIDQRGRLTKAGAEMVARYRKDTP